MELQPTRLLCLCDSLGKNTGVGNHSLLQGILPSQRLNLCLLGAQQVDSLLSEPPGKPKYMLSLLSIRNSKLKNSPEKLLS